MADSQSESASSRFEKARAVFRKHGGIVRTAQALSEGVHPETLYSMRDSGELEVINRGVYRLADCFKFRTRIGMDTAVESIRFYRERRRLKIEDLIHYASICRVKEIIRPNLEAILS